MFGSVPGLQQVKAQEAALDALCAALDPDAIPMPDVDGVWAALAARERLIAGARVRLARRVEQSTAWRKAGHRSPAEWLARQAGTTLGQARGALAASQQLTQLPDVEEAVRQGKLSGAQTEAVADAATANAGATPTAVAAGRPRQGAPEACPRR